MKRKRFTEEEIIRRSGQSFRATACSPRRGGGQTDERRSVARQTNGAQRSPVTCLFTDPVPPTHVSPFGARFGFLQSLVVLNYGKTHPAGRPFYCAGSDEGAARWRKCNETAIVCIVAGLLQTGSFR